MANLQKENEIFISVVGYEGIYEISSFGRLKRIGAGGGARVGHTSRERINKVGYVRYGLSRQQKVKHFFAHVLVAKSFIPNPDNKPQVNHINGIRHDNRIENLEWVTASENVRHGFSSNGRKISDYCKKKIIQCQNKPVIGYDINGVAVHHFLSFKYAAEYFNGKQPAISACVSGRRPTAYGFKWVLAKATGLPNDAPKEQA